MTFKRYTKREWIPYDGNCPKGSNFWQPSFADSFGEVSNTCCCGRPTAVVYQISSCCVPERPPEAANPKLVLCSECATQLALGILRDVTEATFGKDVANTRYDAV